MDALFLYVTIYFFGHLVLFLLQNGTVLFLLILVKFKKGAAHEST